MSSEIFTTPPNRTPPPQPLFPPNLFGPNRFQGLRWAGIAALALALQLPILRIGALIEERQTTRQAASDEIATRWGGPQDVMGPVLMVPYLHGFKDSGGQERTETRHAFLLPEALEFEAKVDPEIRKRGIFEMPVFTADVRASGRFDLARLKEIAPANAQWDRASLLLPQASLKDAAAPVRLAWRGARVEFAPREKVRNFSGGLEAPAPLDPAMNDARFVVDMKLRGSLALNFVPLGKTTRVRMASPWPSPSFAGATLPGRHAIDKQGFTAEWNAFSPAHIHPPQWLSSERSVNPLNWETAGFGVNFVIPADAYAKTSRSTKYSLLFIAMTFLTFYLLETFRKSRVHILQYALVGLALCLFYMLLLSLSEHVAFGLAYLASLAAILSLTGLYLWGVFGKAREALGVTAALGALYGYLYVVLNAEDHALLFGTLGLLGMLAAVMYATRRLNAGKPAADG